MPFSNEHIGNSDKQIFFGDKQFNTKKELHAYLIANKSEILAQKSSAMKTTDCGVIVKPIITSHNRSANKAAPGNPDIESMESLKAICIINTTNFLDEHMDLHVPGLWNKSLSENKKIMHLQEHNLKFDHIISSGKDLKAYTKTYKWSELGYDYPGETEALVFDSTIQKARNPFMLYQYANGWVENHSVGMYYVRFGIALDDEENVNEYEAWKKYYPMIVNPEKADERGYFFFVLEAKCVEGSAVPLGSNSATPTIEVNTNKSKVTCPDCGYEFEEESALIDTSIDGRRCPKCGKPVNQKGTPGNSTCLDPEPDSATQGEIDYKYILSKLLN